MLPPMPHLSVPSIRVVVADVTPDVRQLVRMILELDGDFEVVGEAANGAEAVRLSEEQEPDVVVLDLAMPVMDGLQAIPEIRRVCASAKIVILSGFEESAMANKALKLGADAYIAKGAMPGDMVAKFKEVCRSAETFPLSTGERGLQVPSPAPEVREERFDSPDILPLLTHELRNQATVIEGMTMAVLRGLRRMPLERVQLGLESVARNAFQMHALVDAFSDARKIDSQALDLCPAEVDLTELVKEIFSDISSLTAPHQLRVAESNTVRVSVDPIRIRQVLTNLLSNAAKFSPSHLSIEVDVAVKGDYAQVLVKDHGPGVPSERREELFRPFSRLDSKISGTGLGLYISRGIARAHGGDLALVGSEEGACFALSLPVTRSR
jgi:DNA-binding NarL/FixJ family response regulator